MNKLVFRFATLLLFVALSGNQGKASDCWEYSKIIKKEFPISGNGRVSISNKYGNIEVHGWNQHRVKIESTILVRASGEDAAQRVFSRIEAVFSSGPDFVDAETRIGPQKKEWWSWGQEEDDFSVSYRVYMPSGARLMANNKYGDMYVSGIVGRTELAVRYGHLSAEGLSAEGQATIEYGTGMIQNAGRLKARLERARLIVEDVAHLDVDSRYSIVQMNKVGEARTLTKYDTYDVDEAGRFVNNGEFDKIFIRLARDVSVDSRLTQLNVGKVTENLYLRVDSSGVQVASIGRYFKAVDLSGKFTDFHIGIEQGASYQMNAVADYAGIRYPSNLRVTYEKEQGDNHEVKGQAGDGKAPRSLRARLSYGALRIGED
ncbi:MAG: hypothetical protein KDC66_00585 [Phaeodactylibacter sp.]|nr:hypothetical protein [Phaeodactylibacter sp.]MCB9276738.1 hypothetical protein [Lewinellaceae bacterium]